MLEGIREARLDLVTQSLPETRLRREIHFTAAQKPLYRLTLVIASSTRLPIPKKA